MPLILLFDNKKILYIILLILNSSVVERSAVNRLVVGSSPTWGENNLLTYFNFLIKLYVSSSGGMVDALVLGTSAFSVRVQVPRRALNRSFNFVKRCK